MPADDLHDLHAGFHKVVTILKGPSVKSQLRKHLHPLLTKSTKLNALISLTFYTITHCALGKELPLSDIVDPDHQSYVQSLPGYCDPGDSRPDGVVPNHEDIENKGRERGRLDERWVAFTSTMAVLGPEIMAHNGWVPPPRDAGGSSRGLKGRKFLDTLLTSVKKNSSDKKVWIRRMNRILWCRLRGQPISKVKRGCDTMGTQTCLVSQHDLERLKDWSKRPNATAEDKQLTDSEKMELKGCHEDEFGLICIACKPQDNSDSACNNRGDVSPEKKKKKPDDTKRNAADSDGVQEAEALRTAALQSEQIAPNGCTVSPSSTPQTWMQGTREERMLRRETLKSGRMAPHQRTSQLDDKAGKSVLPVDASAKKNSKSGEALHCPMDSPHNELPDAQAFEEEASFEQAKQTTIQHLEVLRSHLPRDHHSFIQLAIDWLSRSERCVYGDIDAKIDVDDLPDCDVYLVKADQFQELLRRPPSTETDGHNKPFIPQRPVKVVQSFYEGHSIADRVKFLCHTKDPLMSQSYGGEKHVPVKATEVQERIASEEARFRKRQKLMPGEEAPHIHDRKDYSFTQMPLNLLDLKNEFATESPAFTYNANRFGLLPLLTRCGQNTSKANDSNDVVDIRNCLDFEIMATTLSFSGAHVDVLGGTWIRVLDGDKLWMFASQRKSTSLEIKEFERLGHEWVPSYVCVAALGKDDVFYMPAGWSVIHAPLTLRPCLIRGGVIWDKAAILPMLDKLYWTCEHNASITNEPIPLELARIITALHDIGARDGYSDFASSCSYNEEAFSSAFERAITKVQSIRCTCRGGRCTKGTCRCLEAKRRCTKFCGHATKSCNYIDNPTRKKD